MKGGEPTVGSKYVQTGNSYVLSNSDVETSWFNGVLLYSGSRTFAAPQVQGLAMSFKGGFFIGHMLSGSTLAFRLVNDNTGIIMQHNLTCPSDYVNQIGWIEIDLQVRENGFTCEAYSRIFIDGEVTHLNAGEGAWDVTLTNTFDITLQFDVADLGNEVQTSAMIVQTIYEF